MAGPSGRRRAPRIQQPGESIDGNEGETQNKIRNLWSKFYLAITVAFTKTTLAAGLYSSYINVGGCYLDQWRRGSSSLHAAMNAKVDACSLQPQGGARQDAEDGAVKTVGGQWGLTRIDGAACTIESSVNA